METKKVLLPLKKGPGQGKEVDVRTALKELIKFEWLQQKHQAHFAALLALAHDPNAKISNDSRDYLDKLRFLTIGLVVHDDLKNVLLASEITTPDGQIICSCPFELYAETKEIIEKISDEGTLKQIRASLLNQDNDGLPIKREGRPR